MTHYELLKQETDEITARTGRFIPHYRLPILMDKAAKISKLLQDPMMSYEECAVILRTVQNTVRDLKGEI